MFQWLIVIVGTFSRRPQSCKIGPKSLRNITHCPWQYFLLMMIHWWLRLVAYIPITRTSPINHWMIHDWHFLGTANHHWASMFSFCCRGTVDGRIGHTSWYGEYPNVYGGLIDISSGYAAFLNHRHPLTKVNQPTDGLSNLHCKLHPGLGRILRKATGSLGGKEAYQQVVSWAWLSFRC